MNQRDEEKKANAGTPWAGHSDAMRKLNSALIYRIGPAPKEERGEQREGNKVKPDHLGNLEVEDEDEDEELGPKEKDKERPTAEIVLSEASAHTKAIINYFSRMAGKIGNDEKVDYKFIYSLIINGAAINVSDKYGQTVMHEVARSWNRDVAKFLIMHGGNHNYPDLWGRTPLHLAAATNHADMVDFLIHSGGNPRARTYGEGQTATHYAAKFNSVDALKVLVKHKVDLNVRDYKGRTPLFIAGEMAREEAAMYLLDIGVRVGVFDNMGMAAISYMIQKMPNVAYEALNQFHDEDIGRRRDYFHLNYLERNPSKWREKNAPAFYRGCGYTEVSPEILEDEDCPITPLEMAVRHGELSVIMHPVMQRLIKTKWEMYGKFGASVVFIIHFSYVLIWTLLGIFLPRDMDYYSHDTITGGIYWRLPLEVLNVVVTVCFIMKEIIFNKISYRDRRTFCIWRRKEVYRDIQFCHPRWAQEKEFLERELETLTSLMKTGGFTSDPWNILEIPTYLSVFLLIVTRAYDLTHSGDVVSIHKRAVCFALIFIWLHFLKSCRPFPSLGVFITLLGYALKETLSFAGFFFLLVIPYAIGFWIVFGGRIPEESVMWEEGINVGWTKLNELLMFSWQVTLNVAFSKRLIMMDRLMSQMMLGTFFALITIMCFNIYIALLSETFIRVYNNAKAFAVQDQAQTILNIENVVSKKRKLNADRYIQECCCPLDCAKEVVEMGDQEEKLWNTVCRTILIKLGDLQDFLSGTRVPRKRRTKKKTKKEGEANSSPPPPPPPPPPPVQPAPSFDLSEEEYDRLYKGAIARDKELYALYTDIHELKCALMKYFDPGLILPDKLKYVPLSTLDANIPPPTEMDNPPPYDYSKEDEDNAVEFNYSKDKRVSISGSARRPSNSASLVDENAENMNSVVEEVDKGDMSEPDEDEIEELGPPSNRSQTPQLRDHKRSKLNRQDKENRRRSAPASVFKELNQMSLPMLSRAVHSSTASVIDLTPIERRSVHGSNNMISSKSPSAVNLQPSDPKMPFAEKGVQSINDIEEQDSIISGSSVANECNIVSHFNKGTVPPAAANPSKKKTRTPRTSESEPPPIVKVNRSTSPAHSLRIDSRATSMTGIESCEELDDASVYSLQWVYPSGPYDIKNASTTSLNVESNEQTVPTSSSNDVEPFKNRARDTDKRHSKDNEEKPRLKSKETYIGAPRIRTESSTSSSSSSSSEEGNESNSDESSSSSSCGSSGDDSLDINSINTSMSSLDVQPTQGPSNGPGQNLNIETDNTSSEDDINLSIDATDYATFQTLMKIRASKWSYQKK